MLTLLDLSAAFDTIDLLTRPENTFGICDLALFFFGSATSFFILFTQPLSDVISHHTMSHHMFADDTELYKSDSPSEAFALSRTIESCVSEVMACIVQNKL